MRLLVRWLINAGAILLVAWILDGIEVRGFVPALVAAAVLGIINAVIRPVVLFLTLPLGCLTLGLFTFVVNALMLWLAAAVVEGRVVADLRSPRASPPSTIVQLYKMVLQQS